MLTKIDFYYWADQCPHNAKLKKMLKELESTGKFLINFKDITEDFGTAERLKIFSPTVMIINDILRLHGPVTREVILGIDEGIIPEAKPYSIAIGSEIIKGELKDLTEETISETCELCASTSNTDACRPKKKWVEKIRTGLGLKNMGKIHFYDGECVGGAEFVPSDIVPYPIPRSRDSAFLTCAFGSSSVADYKTYPLEILELELFSQGYKNLLCIATEDRVFPNGPLDWFIKNGFEDLGEVYYEKMHLAKMHLVKKILK